MLGCWRSARSSSTGISFPPSTGSHPHCGRSPQYSVKLVAIANPDRCLVLRSNSVRAIDQCLSLCRCTRLLTPKLQQTDANPNLFVANPANRKLSNRVWQACQPRERQPPGGRFQEERWNYERTDFGLANRRERRLNHPEFKANTYQPGAYKNEYKHRAILVCLEACGADSPVCGTESTVARRTSSGRGRSPVVGSF